MHRFDAAGKPLTSKLVTTFTGGSSSPGTVDPAAIRIVAHAIPGGGARALIAQTAVIGGTGETKPKTGELHLVPISSSAQPGQKVILQELQLSNSRFDAVPVPGSVSLYAVAWVDDATAELRVRRYDGATPFGDLVTLPAVNVTDVRMAAGAGLEQEDLLIAWTEFAAGEGDVKVARIGAALADSPVMLPGADGPGDQRLGDLDVFTDGGFVLVTAGGAGVEARRYNALGFVQGSPATVSALGADRDRPSVAVLDGDDWVAVFVAADGTVWTRRFDRQGEDSLGAVEQPVTAATGAANAPAGTAGLAVWDDLGVGAIVAQNIEGAARPIGAPVVVAELDGPAGAPAVAPTGGDFAIAWEAGDSDGAGILGQVASGPPVQVNQDEAGAQRRPTIAGTGDLVLAWETPGDGVDVVSRTFGPALSAPADAIALSATAATGDQTRPALAAGAGVFLAAWESTDDGAVLKDVFVRQVGTAPELRINDDTGGNQQRPAVGVTGDGSTGLVCWETPDPVEVSAWAVSCRRVSLGLEVAPLGSEAIVNPDVPGDQRAPAVVGLDDGFLVAWRSPGIDDDGTAIQVQRIGLDGAKVGPARVANRGWAGDQSQPFLALEADGVLVGWIVSAPTGTNVVMRRITP